MPDQYAAFFKCLSAWSRNRILRLLGQHGELSVEDLSRRLGLTEPTVSRHLQLLRLHGIVRLRREARVHYYSLNEELLRDKFGTFLDFVASRPPSSSQTA